MTRMEQLMQRLPEGIDCAWISADVNADILPEWHLLPEM